MRRSIVLAAISVAAALSLSGCMFQTASGGFSGPQTLSGTVTGWPITGTYQANLSIIRPVPSSCGGTLTAIEVTLSDGAGNTVTMQKVGILCPDRTFLGQYTIAGGTGIYQGATGSGTSTLQISGAGTPDDPFGWSSQDIGTFEVPGTASATSQRKTFKMRGTVKSGATSKGNK